MKALIAFLSLMAGVAVGGYLFGFTGVLVAFALYLAFYVIPNTG